MPLAKMKVPISFGKGINTKIDPKQQILGVLNLAENAVFETLQSAKKRNGYDSILLETTTGSSISSAKALTKFKNELNLFDETKFYSFSEALQKLQDKGSVYSVFPTTTPVVQNSYNYENPDSIQLENLNIFAYRNASLGSVRYTVKDSLSGSVIISDDEVESTGSLIRVTFIQNFVYLIYANSGNLKYRRFNILTPHILETAVSIASNFDSSNPKLDVVSSNNKIIIAYRSTVVGAQLQIISIDSTGTVGSAIGVTSANPTNALEICVDSGYRVIISFADTTTVRYLIYSFSLTAPLLGITTLETISNVKTISCAQNSSEDYQFIYEISSAAAVDHRTKKVVATLAGSVGTPTTHLRSAGLAAKLFKINNNIYVPLSFETTLQSTYFISDLSGTIVSKVNPSIAGLHITSGVLGKTNILSSTKVSFAGLIKTKVNSENGTFFSLFGVTNTVLDFDIINKFQNSPLNSNLHIAGGILQMYDGDSVVEHGFHVYPETLVAGASGHSGSMSNGDYSYIAVYKWTDNYGQDHRSAPSIPLQFTLSGGGSNQSQVITVPTLRLTNKENVVIELYRTEDNGSIYYKTSSTTSPTFNDKTIDTVDITDTLSDATLITKEILYTTGGVLENIAAPSASIVATHTASSRIFLAGLENPNNIQYSKIANPGFPVEFNDTLLKTVDPIGGPITAMASMDEKLVIFEQDAIFYISGTGPNNLGQQDNFTDPERVSTDVGCLDPQSVVLTPEGLMFKSRKGIFILTRGLSLQYIGAPVERYNSLDITSAKVIAEANQVRFTTNTPDCLVYNYQLGLWSTFTNHSAKSAEVLGNDYYYIRSDAELFKENRSSFSDNGSPIKLRLETGWMSFAELQGFQRVYKMLILGDYKSSHKLRVRFAYDFNEAFIQEKVIDPLDFINAAAYGEESPYGSGTPYGGSGNVYQPRVALKQQKCQSLKIRIEDQQDVPGEGLSLSAVTLEIGGKQGLNKVSSTRKYGAS